MQNDVDKTMSEIVAILIKKIWIIFLCTLICTGGAYIVTRYVIDEKYTSSVSMYVLPNSENVNLIASLSELNYAQEIVNTYIEILRTDIFLKAVAEEAMLNYSPGDLKEMIEMKSINSTEIFEVNVTTKIPEDSLLLARTISELAPQKIIEIKNADDVKVVDPATLPQSPSSPNVMMNTIIGFIIGIILGMMIAVLIFKLDKRIKDEDDILRHYHVPILGIVPVIQEQGGSENVPL